jgi:hypothetical protein
MGPLLRTVADWANLAHAVAGKRIDGSDAMARPSSNASSGSISATQTAGERRLSTTRLQRWSKPACAAAAYSLSTIPAVDAATAFMP